MIRLQIVERPGEDLFPTLKEAMRSGDLRTFSLQKRGWKVVHEKYPGWINWSYGQGVITCEILSPRKLGSEWQLLSAFVGRLSHKFASRVESMNIQLTPPEEAKPKRRRR
jgi:hypothetical protein